MMSAAAQSTPRARLALARASTTSAAQQTRQYSYGPWQVDADHDVRGRHRSVRYRYMDTLSRRLAWDNKCASTAATTPSYGQAMSNASLRYADAANVKSWSDDLSGLGASKPAAGLEREAVEQLLRPQQDTPQSVENLRLPVKSVRDYVQEFAPKGSTEPITSEQSQYKDLNAYNPVTFDSPNDPNTVWELTSEETSKHYNDLQKYRPIEWNEPDGLLTLSPEEQSKQYNDLHKYGPVRWNEPDGLQPPNPEELTKKYDDLHRYAQYDNDGPSSATSAAGPEFNEHDLEIRLKTAAHQAPVDQLEISTPDVPAGTIKAAARRRFVNLEDAKKSYQTDFEADVPKGPVSEAQPIVDVELEAARRVEKLEDGKAAYAAEWGAAEEHLQPLVAEQLDAVAEDRLAQLETAKVEHERRFEQEVDEGFTSMDESFPASTGKFTVQDALNQLAAQQEKGAAAARAHAQRQRDLYSKIPQGLEVSYSLETGGKATWPTRVTHYRSEANERAEKDSPSLTVSDDAAAASQTTAAAAEYVVLAFDPLTQTVNAAVTSSVAGHDTSSSAQQTPAETLLRLSNPARFFPHFKPLHAAGYEMVSGRGGVLIFRKVGQGVPGAPVYDPSVIGRKRSLGRTVVVGTAVVAGAAYGVGTWAEYVSTHGMV